MVWYIFGGGFGNVEGRGLESFGRDCGEGMVEDVGLGISKMVLWSI